MTAMATTHTSRPRKPTAAKLSPAAVHELDILRAARQGIDLSGLAPEERCKYPSKFCCHKRTRKSTGKLHRFCEYHRTRASVNQKRWTEIRRRHQLTQETIETSRMVYGNQWDGEMEMEMGSPASPRDRHHHHHQSKDTMESSSPSSPTHVNHDSLAISDDEIDMLMTMLTQSDSGVSASHNTRSDFADPCAWLSPMLLVDPPSMASSSISSNLWNEMTM